MKKLLKITGVLFLLILIAAIALPFIFKDEIVAKVKQEANKNIKGAINFGDFDLSIFRDFPNFSLEIENVSLAGAGLFEKDTLFSTSSVDVTLDLMSVFNGEQYQVKEIQLNQPRIRALVLPDGTANWDIAITDETASAASSETSTFDIRLDALEINNGYVYYNDRQANMQAELVNLNHKLSGNFSESNYDINTNTTIGSLLYAMDGMNYLKKVKVELDAAINIDMPGSRYTLKENTLKLNELILGFDGWVAIEEKATNMDMKFEAKETDFRNILSLIPAVYLHDFNQVKTSGKLALNGNVKGRMTEEKMPAFNLALNISNGSFRYPDLPKDVKNIALDLQVENKDGAPDHTMIDIRKFHMEMAGNPVDIKMRVTSPVSDPNVDGFIKGKVELSSMKEVVPMEAGESMDGTITADITVKGRQSSIDKGRYDEFNLAGVLDISNLKYTSPETTYDIAIRNAQFGFSPKFVEMTSFDGKIGSSDLNAKGRIDNLLNYIFKDDLLTGSFGMTATTFDLNQFTTEEENAPATPETAEETTGVIEVPSNLDFKIDAKVGRLIYENLDLTQVVADLHIKDSKIKITNLGAGLMGGTMKLSGNYNTTNVMQPEMDLVLEVKDFDIRQTFDHFESVRQMVPIASKADGKFSTNFTITGRLDENMNPVYSTLNGGGKLLTNQVTLRDFKVAQQLAGVLKMPQLDPLTIQNANPSFKFRDGRVYLDPFDIKAGPARANISGSNGFDQTLDYIWKLDIPTGALGAQATGAINQLAGKAGLGNISGTSSVAVNAKITGTATDPKIDIGMKEFTASVKEQVQQQIEEKVEEIKEDVKAAAREQADKLLKEAEIQANRIKQEAANAAAQIRKEGYAAADKVEAEAKNPVAKVAAKKAADKMRNETDVKAQKVVDEGNRNANKVLDDARKKADELTR